VSDATSLSDFALAALMTYGPFALALTLLLGGAGVPLPGSIVLLAAGAFARQGFISWPYALLGGVVGVVLGDSVAYLIGRMGGAWAERRFSNVGGWQAATDQFARRGGWAIFLTRFLITPLGVAVSVIAGISAYPFRRFLLLDVAGEILWVAGYGLVGYALGSQWQAASQLLSDFSGLILGVAILVAGAVLVWRMPRRSNVTPVTAPTPQPQALQIPVALIPVD
jgi:membrane protein DedA with SNARE-associated domain